jgi:predicted short-subunit dehydrogenase-like oxidoreductase (DUF2520 family)
MSPTPTTNSFVLIGAGRVGTAVARLLHQAGYSPIAVGPEDRESSRRTAALLGSDVCSLDSLPPANIVLLGVPEEAMGLVASKIAASLQPDTLVVHFAGALGTGPLTPVTKVRARACALHPVQSCPDAETAFRRLPGSAWGVTCAASEELRAARLVRDSGGNPVMVPEDLRPVWHAAAVTVSNSISALLSAGEQMLTAIGIGSTTEVLTPLAAGTVANARERGGGAATLTGPIARGEWKTIEGHIAALRSLPDGLLDLYLLAARLTLESAWVAGHLTRDSYDRISSELASG